MKTQIITKSEIKGIKLTKNVDLAIKHQNYFRKSSGKVSNINDQTDFTKSKKRAIEIVEQLEFNNLAYEIQLRKF